MRSFEIKKIVAYNFMSFDNSRKEGYLNIIRLYCFIYIGI